MANRSRKSRAGPNKGSKIYYVKKKRKEKKKGKRGGSRTRRM
jgi:hypothetical protein